MLLRKIPVINSALPRKQKLSDVFRVNRHLTKTARSVGKSPGFPFVPRRQIQRVLEPGIQRNRKKAVVGRQPDFTSNKAGVNMVKSFPKSLS